MNAVDYISHQLFPTSSHFLEFAIHLNHVIYEALYGISTYRLFINPFPRRIGLATGCSRETE